MARSELELHSVGRITWSCIGHISSVRKPGVADFARADTIHFLSRDANISGSNVVRCHAGVDLLWNQDTIGGIQIFVANADMAQGRGGVGLALYSSLGSVDDCCAFAH